MNNAIHFVLDLETMSTAPNAAIAAIGCVRVQQGQIVDEFYERVNLESSRAMGGEIDTPTLQWWLTQPLEARQEVSGELPGQSIIIALTNLSDFMHRGGLAPVEPLVWGNGSSFDNVILGSAYQRAGIPLPWKFWNDRDLRTLLALYPQAKKAIAFEGIKHHALNDARHEARQLIAALEAHAAQQPDDDMVPPDPASAAIEYALNDDSPMEFLRCWLEGDFEALRTEWHNVPDEVFVGADPLFIPATAEEGKA